MEPVKRALLSSKTFLRLKRGKPARPSRRLRMARSGSRKASWGGALGDLHPPEGVLPLPSVPLLVEVHRGWDPLAARQGLPAADQTPVVGEAGREARGSVARECLERYRALLAHGREELRSLGLTEEEALRVMEVLNGVFHTPHHTPQTAHLVWGDVADRLGDEHPLTQKVRSLSPAGRFALVDLAERFWRGTHEVLREIIREEP